MFGKSKIKTKKVEVRYTYRKFLFQNKELEVRKFKAGDQEANELLTCENIQNELYPEKITKVDANGLEIGQIYKIPLVSVEDENKTEIEEVEVIEEVNG